MAFIIGNEHPSIYFHCNFKPPGHMTLSYYLVFFKTVNNTSTFLSSVSAKRNRQPNDHFFLILQCYNQHYWLCCEWDLTNKQQKKTVGCWLLCYSSTSVAAEYKMDFLVGLSGTDRHTDIILHIFPLCIWKMSWILSLGRCAKVFIISLLLDRRP